MPSNALVYTVPPGAAGTSSNILVSNANGTSQTGNTINYLPATKQYSVQDILADGVYDAKREVYYFTGANQVYVFSLSEGAWKNPIPIPAPKGASGPQRLFGIALSPDGSKLAISDPGAVAIYILDPDQPTSIQSFAITTFYGALTVVPADVAITNSGSVYFTAFDLNGDGAPAFLMLNPSTGAVGALPGNMASEGDDPDVRLALSADGTRVYVEDEGGTGYYDTVAGQFVYASNADYDIGQNSDELALCACQTLLSFNGFMADSNLNNLGWQALDIAEQVDANYVYGAAYSADGSLFFQPGVQSIDVFDGHTGVFRARVSLPFQLSTNFRALVSNNRDSTLVAIVGNGSAIGVIDLNSLPEPQPISYAEMARGPLGSRLAQLTPLAATMDSATSAGTTRTAARLARPHAIRHLHGTLLDSLMRNRAAFPVAERRDVRAPRAKP
jgi:hypothetical protein